MIRRLWGWLGKRTVTMDGPLPPIPDVASPPMDAPDQQWLDFAAVVGASRWVPWSHPKGRAKGIRLFDAYNRKWSPTPLEEP